LRSWGCKALPARLAAPALLRAITAARVDVCRQRAFRKAGRPIVIARSAMPDLPRRRNPRTRFWRLLRRDFSRLFTPPRARHAQVLETAAWRGRRRPAALRWPGTQVTRHCVQPRVFLLGATGTIAGTSRALVGAATRSCASPDRSVGRRVAISRAAASGCSAEPRFASVSHGCPVVGERWFPGERFDVWCRAWLRVPLEMPGYRLRAHAQALELARTGRVSQVILLSAFARSKALLAFQHAKLAFEKLLIASGLTYTIVRPTAFFKSLSGRSSGEAGQAVPGVGDGRDRCKPISDRDLASTSPTVLDDEGRLNKILPLAVRGTPVTAASAGGASIRVAQPHSRFRQLRWHCWTASSAHWAPLRVAPRWRARRSSPHRALLRHRVHAAG